jgi:hypothetical protein
MQLENQNFIASLVWLFSMPEIIGLSSSISRKSLPMGVNCRVYYLVFITDDEVDILLLL